MLHSWIRSHATMAIAADHLQRATEMVRGTAYKLAPPPKMTYGSVNVTSMLLPVGASSSGA